MAGIIETCVLILIICLGSVKSDGVTCSSRSMIDESFYLLPNVRQEAHHQDASSGTETYMHGVYEPKSRSHVTCPVYYILNFNPARSPQMVMEARCSCANAFCDSNHISRCLPIYYYRKVNYTVNGCQSEVVAKFVVGCEYQPAQRSKPVMSRML